MAEVRISQEDLDGLGRKLGSLQLSGSERILLLYMFSLAADAISRSRAESATDSPEPTAGPDSPVVVLLGDDKPASSIQDQFSSAFTPGPVDPVGREPGSFGP